MGVKILITFCVITCSLNFALTFECITPDKKQGKCKVIRSCPRFYSILRRIPVSPESVIFLKQAHCGFDGLRPKVCCPIDADPMTGFGSSPSKTVNRVSSPNSLLPNITQCGLSTEARIFGGQATELDEFPWMALIEYENVTTQNNNASRLPCIFCCGGSLINKRYILTAAHCVTGQDGRKIVGVRLGEYDYKNATDCIFTGRNWDCAPPPLTVEVEQTIVYENYNQHDSGMYHDIALLRLSKDVPFSPYIRPICLPTSQEQLSKSYVGENLTVAGWGQTGYMSWSSVKHKVQVPVKNNSACSPNFVLAQVTLCEGQICAGGENGRDSCHGDSGGALMATSADPETGEVNWYAAGVVSYSTYYCGATGWPAIYTRVSKYMDWILSKLQP